MICFAQGGEPRWWFWLLAIAGFVVLGAFAILVLSKYEAFARRALTRIYRDFDLKDSPSRGNIYVVFHTYHGLAVRTTQMEHRVYVTAGNAKALLNRLLRFNLTWGLLSYYGMFVPPISLFNYLVQRRSITRQMADVGV